MYRIRRNSEQGFTQQDIVFVSDIKGSGQYW